MGQLLTILSIVFLAFTLFVAITGLGMLERSGMLVAVVFISWLIYHSILSGELEVAASRRSRC